MVIALLLAAFGCVSDKEGSVAAQARISRADAEKTALTRVPDGKIREGELEKEKGRLIWSFDIARAGTEDITEVHVDALTGAIVSTEKESAAAEAKEKK